MTAGIVFSSVRRSRPKDQRCTYCRSNFSMPLMVRSLRPETCHKPVMPGSARLRNTRICGEIS